MKFNSTSGSFPVPVPVPYRARDLDLQTKKRFNHVPLGASPSLSGPLGDARDQIVHMNALAPDDRSLTGEVDQQFLLDMALNDVDNLHFYDPDLYPPGSGPYPSVSSAQINGISNRLGPVPLLAQMDEIPPELFCNATSVGAGEECEREWCECVHKLTVWEGEVVEVVLISPSAFSNFTHPLHLHGYSYRVVAMDKGPEGIMTPELFREMDARGEIKRKLSRAPFKDTVAMPNGGYVVLRLVADNPGVWFAHCHLQYHVEEGMSFSLEVLQSDGTLPPPPPDFPRCGPYVPPPPLSSHRRDEGPATAVGREHQEASGDSHLPDTASRHHLHHHHHEHHPPRQAGIDLSTLVVPALSMGMVLLLLLLLLLLVLVYRLRRDNQRLLRRHGHVYHGIQSHSEEEEKEADDEQRSESGSDDFLWTPGEEKARLVG